MSQTKKEVPLKKTRHEQPDPVPAALPIGFKHPPTLAEQIRRMVRQQLDDYATQNGSETFEEADDFDVGDDVDPSSPYEEDPNKEETLEREFHAHYKNKIAQQVEAQKKSKKKVSSEEKSDEE